MALRLPEENSMKYAGRTAVITGAGSGIGQALAVELAGRGANVAISDVDKIGLSHTAELCGEKTHVRTYELDVADRGAMLQHAEEVVRDFGDVHLMVNNAGVALAATVETMEWEDYDWLMGINLGGVVNGTKAFLPHLIASGDGHLVNISSVFGFVAVPTQSAYNAAKFAVRGFTEALRQEMIIERHPVGVHCVHPGGIRTNIARNARIGDGLSEDRERNNADFTRFARTSPAKAATTILKGVDRNSARILIGADAYVFDAVPRVLGARYEGLLARGTRLAGKRTGLTLGKEGSK
jgi:short-subunit dehydrogenase